MKAPKYDGTPVQWYKYNGNLDLQNKLNGTSIQRYFTVATKYDDTEVRRY